LWASSTFILNHPYEQRINYHLPSDRFLDKSYLTGMKYAAMAALANPPMPNLKVIELDDLNQIPA